MWFLALALGTAQATELVYRWTPGRTLVYDVEVVRTFQSGLTLPEAQGFPGMRATLSCEVGAAEQERLPMQCTLGSMARITIRDQAVAQVTPFEPPLDTVRVTWTPTGRIEDFGLVRPEGMTEAAERDITSFEYWVGELVSALEVELPQGGEPRRGKWRASGPMLSLQVPSSDFHLGSTGIRYQLESESEDGVWIVSKGQAGAMAAETLTSHQQLSLIRKFEGRAHFDPARGLLVENVQHMTDVGTAGSAFFYYQGPLGHSLYATLRESSP
ncbi:MAG: hypothetical protein QGG40_15810 [Myxococcota bacterium]|nr:hypothetical protein [Myxococcota bacterium]